VGSTGNTVEWEKRGAKARTKYRSEGLCSAKGGAYASRLQNSINGSLESCLVLRNIKETGIY